MKNTDTLIVGQGIAGSMVAFMLYQKRIPFKVIDPVLSNTSSRIAAGMFTPVSGKRKTIHPEVLQQIPFAINIYKQLEALLGARLLYINNVYQVFNSAVEKVALTNRFSDPEFKKYIKLNPAAITGVKQPFGACEITHSGWVDCALLIGLFGHWLKQHDAFIEDIFSYPELVINSRGMQYKGIAFKHLIFCEGYKAVHNPFFNEHIIPCKGDLLTFQCAGLVTNSIIKKNSIYCINTGQNIFKGGATYGWGNSNEEPEESGQKQLVNQLYEMFENNYNIVHHQSAIRPTTQNREVIVKQHPGYAGMYMLNGMGTKGILQAPWWAHQLAATAYPEQ